MKMHILLVMLPSQPRRGGAGTVGPDTSCICAGVWVYVCVSVRTQHVIPCFFPVCNAIIEPLCHPCAFRRGASILLFSNSNCISIASVRSNEESEKTGALFHNLASGIVARKACCSGVCAHTHTHPVPVTGCASHTNEHAFCRRACECVRGR